MRALLMAAGTGTRISRHLGETPKCTLDIGGEPLVRHTTRMLLQRGFAVSVVLGYRKDAVIDCLAGLSVSYFHNPFFQVTNSIASLWFARSAICGPGDVIIANADVYWEEDVLDELVGADMDPVMLADSSRAEEGDYLFKFEGSKLLQYGKDLKMPDVSGEYVGIAKIGRDLQNVVLGRLQVLIEGGKHSCWWEDVLYSFIEDGRDVYVKDIKGHFWSEIDFIEDYERILKYRRHLQAVRQRRGASRAFRAGRSLAAAGGNIGAQAGQFGGTGPEAKAVDEADSDKGISLGRGAKAIVTTANSSE